MNGVRRSGFITLVVAGAVTALLIYLIQRFYEEGWRVAGYGIAVPGAFALGGLIQLVSGVPFSELSDRWDSLQGWQRGVLGTLIFVVASGLLVGLILLFAIVFYG